MSFEFWNPEDKKRRFQPTEQELSLLREIWMQLSPSGEKKVYGKQILSYLKTAGLSDYDIRQIWMIANADNNEHLDQQEMLTAIRLITYAQKGIPLSEQCLKSPLSTHYQYSNIAKTRSLPEKLPKNMLVPDLEAINSFHNKWLTLEHKSSGLAKGSDIKSKYKDKAPKQILSQIWALCSRTVKGHMTKGETLLFEHFLNLKKQSVSVNSLPQESKQLIESIDNENTYKIKSYSTQLEQRKQNSERQLPGNIDTMEIQRMFDANNQQIHTLKAEIVQIKVDQSSSMSKALETIQRLKKVIDVQNGQIKELKTTLDNRGELDLKRAEFVEVCEYSVINHSSGFKKKQTPISNLSSTQIVRTKHQQHQPQQQQYSKQSFRQPGSLAELKERTIRLILERKALMPDQMRSIQRRLAKMPYEQLLQHYNELQRQAAGDKATNEADISIASTQKLEMIKNVFGNISLDGSEHQL